MPRRILAAAALAAALATAVPANANHAGCVAHPAIPSCSYTAIGSHQCAGYTDASWEVSVIRIVAGEEEKVVLAGGDPGPVVGESVAAAADETVTLTINADGPQDQPAGLITCGNTAGHP